MKRRVHILQVIGSTGLYGAERWILALMRGLDSQRYRVTLVNLVDSRHETSEIVSAAKQRGLPSLDFHTGGRFNPLAILRLVAFVKKEKVDIIHTHGFKSDLIGLLVARIAGCRILTTPHGWTVKKNLKLFFYEYLDRFSFFFMDSVCPLSKSLYLDAKRFSNKRTILIENGVDIEEIKSTSKKAIAGNSFIIGYIGRLAKEKDLPTLLKAVSLIFKKGKNVKLVLVGDGKQSDILKSEAIRLGISEIIEFKGFRSDAVSFLKSFDCFVLPSLSEGTPRSIMEAMALKIPVVGSNIDGNRNLITNKKTGLLFNVGDCRDLAESICFYMDQKNELKVMVENAYNIIEQKYSNIKMAEEYSKVYSGYFC